MSTLFLPSKLVSASFVASALACIHGASAYGCFGEALLRVSNSDSVACELCDLSQVTLSLCASGF